MLDREERKAFTVTWMTAKTTDRLKRLKRTWKGLMRLSSLSTCKLLLSQMHADVSFLFTLEEFVREIMFLLDTVQEVRLEYVAVILHTKSVQITTAEQMTVWDHLRSVWPSKRARKERKTRYLYKQIRRSARARITVQQH